MGVPAVAQTAPVQPDLTHGPSTPLQEVMPGRVCMRDHGPLWLRKLFSPQFCSVSLVVDVMKWKERPHQEKCSCMRAQHSSVRKSLC